MLNINDLDWESVWWRGWRDGERGQNQHGIDVVGVMGADAVAFQVKKLKKFTKQDTEKAVECYAQGKRPFGARRFVLVTYPRREPQEAGKDGGCLKSWVLKQGSARLRLRSFKDAFNPRSARPYFCVDQLPVPARCTAASPSASLPVGRQRIRL